MSFPSVIASARWSHAKNDASAQCPMSCRAPYMQAQLCPWLGFLAPSLSDLGVPSQGLLSLTRDWRLWAQSPVNPALGASRWFLEYCKCLYIHYPGLGLCDSDRSFTRFRANFTSMTKVPLDSRKTGEDFNTNIPRPYS